MSCYPRDKIYEETAFIGYYLHWNKSEIWELPHLERQRWCEEISKINRKMNRNSGSSKEKNNPFSLENL